ncbi:MAG: cytochrome c3 family protein [Burkholderiales bacterium]|jgi:fumarate reductase flavoprotein subunit|nr:cytochrome c3 family protein [Burkholderiales bacterium]
MKIHELVTKIGGAATAFVLFFGLLTACSQSAALKETTVSTAPSVVQKTAALSPEAQVAVITVREKGMSPDHLAGVHQKKAFLDCVACHSDNIVPNDTASVVNGNCVSCHGNYDKMAAVSKAKAKNPNINVHDSHLGPEIACSTCHQGHQESLAYCSYCHSNFNLPIPGGAATLPESKQIQQWKK